MSSSTSSDVQAVDSLKGPLFPDDRSRFDEWKMKMMAFLDARGLLSTILAPSKYIPHTKCLSDDEHKKWLDECNRRFQAAESLRAIKKKSEYMNDDHVLFQNEILKCKQTCSILINSFKEKQINLVQSVFPTNPYEMWTTINNAYGIVKTTDTLSSLLDQFTHVKKHSNERICDYFARVTKLVSQLKLLNLKIDEKMKRYYLLAGLRVDAKWNLQIQLIEKIDRNGAWKEEELEQYLVSEENKQQVQLESSQSDTALIVHNNNNNNNDKINNNNNFNGKREHRFYNRESSRGRGHVRGRGRGRGRGGRGGSGYSYNYNQNQNQYNRNEYQRGRLGSGRNYRGENNNNNNNNRMNENGGGSHYSKRNNSEIECYKCGERNHIAKNCLANVKKVKHGAYSAIVGNRYYFENNNNNNNNNNRNSRDDSDDDYSYPTIALDENDVDLGVRTRDLSSLSALVVGKGHVDSGDRTRDFSLTSASSLPLHQPAICPELDFSSVWILDSGATSHHTGNRKLLTNVRKLQSPRKTMTGDGESEYDEVGEAWLDTEDVVFRLDNVIYVPGFKVNLISVSRLTDMGYKVECNADRAHIVHYFDDNPRILFVAARHKNL